MTFHDWYHQSIVPELYREQAEYEQESVAFSKIESLTREEILNMFESMSVPELKLALFDHVKACMREHWEPNRPNDLDER